MTVFWMIVCVGVCTLGGIWLAERLQLRCVILEDMLLICRSVRIQSACGGVPLVQTLMQVEPKSRQVTNLLHDFCTHLECDTAGKAWETAVVLSLENCGMTKSDLHFIAQIGTCMGTFLQQQQPTLSQIEKELENLLQQAKQNFAKKGAMRTKLGLLSGLMLALLIW